VQRSKHTAFDLSLGPLTAPISVMAPKLVLQRARLLFLAGWFASAVVAFAQQGPRLEVVASNETAPAGGTVQIKLSFASPRGILNGRLAINLDPAFFGDVASVAVFSANGDATGEADLQGRRISLRFSSPSAGIGRIAGLPVAVVNVPILAGARPGTMSTVIADSSVTWKDDQGVDNTIQVRSGVVTVGGALSMKRLTPMGDILPAGTILTIEGAGFVPATTAEIEGAATAVIFLENPTTLKITLSGPAVLTGKRLRLRNPDGSTVDHFLSQPGAPVWQLPAWLPATFAPLLPLQVSNGWSGPGGFGVAGTSRSLAILVQNPSPGPVDVTFRGIGLRSIVISRTTRVVEGGQTAVFDVLDLFSSAFSSTISANVPIRVASVRFDPTAGVGLTLATPSPAPVASVSVDPFELTVAWQIGTPDPEPIPLRVCSFGEAFDYIVQVTTKAGGPWLSAPPGGRSLLTTTACPFTGPSPLALPVQLTPGGLGPGTYSGSLVLTPAGGSVVSRTVPVTLIVSQQPQISVASTLFNFNYEVGTPSAPPPATIQVNTNGSPAPFTVEAVYESGMAWFTAAPTSATAPAGITATANPSGLAIGNYAGQITIRGPANQTTVRVTMSVFTRVFETKLGTSPEIVRFSWRQGSPVPESVRVSVGPILFFPCPSRFRRIRRPETGYPRFTSKDQACLASASALTQPAWPTAYIADRLRYAPRIRISLPIRRSCRWS